MAINIGTGILDLIANTARLSSDLGKALSHVEKFQRQANRLLGAVGIGLSAAGFVAFVKGAIDSADAINDLQKRVGGTAQDLLVLQGAAERSGVGLDEISGVISKLTPRLNDAAQGTGDAAAAFRILGYDIKQAMAEGKTIPQILGESGAKFREFNDGVNKANLGIAAFGKGGDRLIAVAEAIEETRKSFERLGIAIDEKVIKQADEFNDAMKDLQSVTGVLGRALIVELLPHLLSAANALTALGRHADTMQLAVSAAVIPIKVFATGFVTLAGVIFTASEALVGFALATERVKKLDFAGALSELRIGFDRATARFSATAEIVSNLWAEMQPSAIKPAFGGKDAPGLPDTSKIEAAAKAAAAARLKLTEEREKRELDVVRYAVERRNKLLDVMYQLNQISNKEYWDERINTAQYAFDQEAALLDKFIARQKAALEKTKKGSADYFNALGNLEETQAKRNRLEEEFGATTNQIYRDKKQAAREYADEVERLNIQMLELSGNTAEAARRTLTLQNRSLREKATINNDTAVLKTIDDIERRADAQARYSEEATKSQYITDRLAISEERIQNSLKVGAISQLEAMRRTGAARQKAVEQFEQIVSAQERIAASSGNEKMIIDAERARAALEGLKAEANVLADTFDRIFQDSFSNFFEDVVSGTKSVSEAFRDMGNSILKEITRLAAQDVASQLFGSGKGGGLGNVFATIFGGRGGSVLDGLGTFVSGIFGRAGGGPISANEPYMVGEEGPEIIVPRHSGMVIPNSGMGTVVNMTVVTKDANSFRQSRSQIASDLSRAITYGQRNG